MDRGQQAERVALAYFRARGMRLIGQRIRTPLAEIDLLLALGEVVYLVEVKSCNRESHWPWRVGRKQAQRLRSTIVWLMARWDRPVRLVYAFVNRRDQVEVIFPLES